MHSYFLLFNILLIFLLPINAQIDTSFTNTSWFWPVFSICLILLISASCIAVIIIGLCHDKQKLNTNFDQSSINSSSPSISSVSFQDDRQYNYFHSPPPPYIANEQPEILFLTSSLPPSYRSSTPIDLSSTLTNPSIPTFYV
ncbi:unnamed protein product [Adineta steineri]|uniref:Uncharacterized protein n=1 Tax=Adineta steineri TaxID=433720 RepID=A0A814YY29_9BILA|nr:unnamed protein product [Adineta steineri]CAF1407146.1 unnamed protein product [Adineta steineri]CAF1408991.1 unnamed protein product [Adineta steineri]